eukprot:scaffold171438_cov20-Tisochrysis_lutea.AAC.1
MPGMRGMGPCGMSGMGNTVALRSWHAWHGRGMGGMGDKVALRTWHAWHAWHGCGMRGGSGGSMKHSPEDMAVQNRKV